MDVGSKRLVAGGVAAGGAMLVMAGCILGAGLAKASPDSDWPFTGPKGDHSAEAYWTEITPYADGTVDDARHLANTVCDALEGGMSEGVLINKMAGGIQSAVSNATIIAHHAEWHFCPDKY